MRAASVNQAAIQGLGLGRVGFKGEDKGVGQIEAGRVDVAGPFSDIACLGVKTHQGDTVAPVVRLDQGAVQRFPLTQGPGVVSTL